MSAARFGASGSFAAATSFNDGGLALVAFDPRNLDRPHPLLPSRFGVAETLAATGPAGEIGEECCPGPMLLTGTGTSTALAGSDVLFATGSPNGFVVRGHLAGSLAQPAGDFDGDGVQDALDVCPVEANPGQADLGSDGVGDACPRPSRARRRGPRHRSATSAAGARAGPATCSTWCCCAARSRA